MDVGTWAAPSPTESWNEKGPLGQRLENKATGRYQRPSEGLGGSTKPGCCRTFVTPSPCQREHRSHIRQRARTTHQQYRGQFQWRCLVECALHAPNNLKTLSIQSCYSQTEDAPHNIRFPPRAFGGGVGDFSQCPIPSAPPISLYKGVYVMSRALDEAQHP